MSEDHKKIELEDVKKGQRVRVVKQYRSHIAMYEGDVVRSDIERSEIELGEGKGSEIPIYVDDSAYSGARFTYILLLEDVPKPKVVRTETVTITHYDDGTKTETPGTTVRVPTVIETLEQFEEYEEYLKKTILRDTDGDYWRHTSGSLETKRTYGDIWLGKTKNVTESCLPLTVVRSIVD